MPVTLSIKNAPDHVVDRLRHRAAQNHRSLQGELMAIIERAAAENMNSRDPSVIAFEIIAEIERMGLSSPSESTQMIREDRDR